MADHQERVKLREIPYTIKPDSQFTRSPSFPHQLALFEFGRQGSKIGTSRKTTFPTRKRPTTTVGGEVDALKPPDGALELSALSVEPWIGWTSPEDDRAKRHQSVEYSGISSLTYSPHS
jgi:hypothetical protein